MTEQQATHETVENGKLVELTYQVIDEYSNQVMTEVDQALSYVHGASEVLSPQITAALAGKRRGEVVAVHVDCGELYGPRDESLVLTEALANVPPEYQRVGTAILMENDAGQTRSFMVTRVDSETITLDGNNPLAGRKVVYRVKIHTVRDATADEVDAGGRVDAAPGSDQPA